MGLATGGGSCPAGGLGPTPPSGGLPKATPSGRGRLLGPFSEITTAREPPPDNMCALYHSISAFFKVEIENVALWFRDPKAVRAGHFADSDIWLE